MLCLSANAFAQADSAASRISTLIGVQPGAIGVRLGMANDWGSATGFSYTLGFVHEGGVDPSDEVIELPDGKGAIYVERKAIWAGEGGLLGATMDMDEQFNLIITPKDKPDNA